MAQRRRSYTAEFKEQAVKQVIDGSRSVVDVAAEQGVHEHTLRTWINAYRRDHVGEELPLSGSERARLQQLEKENRELRLKGEFLGKAAAFFAREYR
jgi:transposase